MNFFSLPVGKRTRHQRLLYAQGLNGIDESLSCGSSKNRDKKRHRETVSSESEDRSNGAGRSKKRKLDEAIKDEKSLSDGSDSEEEESDENGSGDNTTSSESDEFSSEESGEDSSDGEESDDPSRSNEVDRSSSSESEEDKSDEKGLDETKSRTCGSSSGYGQDDIEIIDVDDYWIKRKGDKGSTNVTKRELHEAKPVDKSLVDESEEEQSNENGSGVRSTSIDLENSPVDVSAEGGRDGEEGSGTAAVVKNEKKECYGSANESHTDDMLILSDDDEEGYKGSSSLTKREHHEAKPVDKSLVDEPEEEQSNEKASGVHSTFVDLEKSSVDVSTEGGRDGEEGTDTATVAKNKKKEADESDSDDMVESDDEEEGSIEKKVAEQDTERESNQSDDSDKVIERKEKVQSIDRKEKGHSVKKETDDLIDDINTHKKANAKGKVIGPCMTENIDEGVKYQESKKSKRKDASIDAILDSIIGQEDDVQENEGDDCIEKGVKFQESNKDKRKGVASSIDAILDSVIGQEDDVQEKEGDDSIPLKFRFDESDDESEEITDESDVEALFEKMNFELQSEEIGSYGNPTSENQDDNDYEDHDKEATHFYCERGNHADIYFEEQTGLRCRLCGAIILESRFVIPMLANYAPDRSRRGYQSSEQQFLNTGNTYFHDADGKHHEICMQTKGTVWELIPKNIQGELYPHQQEGFKFLWENLAGTIELQGLQKLGPCGGGGGGGCIISHAPGTGKTLLTIVFIESFLKKFPKCCPLIIVPSNMLDTWEAEFKKWQVGFLFINLNTTDPLSKEMNISSRNNTDLIRALKIRSWCDGGSVLGVSYSLYEKIIGNVKTKNVNLEKMGSVLLDMPGLVILDEGHTPRNQRSNIWNILLKLKTKNRVILSGTPFQNNFRELFNTLRLVRPETAANIENEKIFADMTQRKSKNKSRSMSTPEDIEKLKKIIAPFVNVHKGHILESKLPGLKQSIILLNPAPLQKGLIENLDIVSNSFEDEHKVALVSVHPSLILGCILTEKEKKLTNKQELEKVRLHPDVGVKTRFVMELIRLSVSLKEKVLIFSQYTAPLDMLKDQITHVFNWDFGREIRLIRGGTHQKLRQTIINNFNDPNSKSKVLLASIKCCSEGIHLIGASRVVLLDVVWNPSVETQAISRAYRLGQKKVVYTYHLMAAGTTEEDKYDRQVEKGRLAEMVFTSSAGEESKMVNRDVSELDDKILQKLVDHQEFKDIFKKIRYPENKTRI